MAKSKVILDVDSGIDDIVAILVALRSRNISVVGISTVNGNVKPSIGALNVLKVLEIEDRLDIPVFQGADRSLKNRFLSSNVKRRRDVSHGKRGLGNLHIDIKRMNDLWVRTTPDELKGTHSFSDFVEFILRRYPEENVSIIATGPLTNIATMVMKRQAIQSRIKEISIMGGSFGSNNRNTFGNVTGSTEFNFYCDPDAARIVLSTKMHPMIRIVGLDVGLSCECSISKDLVNSICSDSCPNKSRLEASNFLVSLLNYKLEQNTAVHLHDVLAVFMLEKPSLFRFTKGMVDVITLEGSARGQCIFNEDTISGHVLVAISVSGSRFKSLLRRRLISM
ncbi:MAG: nucleoside hydrolase [Nitrososphaeraceae archaeon]